MIDSKGPSRRMKSLTRHNDRQGQQVYVSLGSGKVVQKGVAMLCHNKFTVGSTLWRVWETLGERT